MIPKRRKLIGTAVSITDYEQVLDVCDEAIAAGDRIYICCAPAHTLVSARRDGELADALDAATVVTPDGVPVVWLARALGEPIDSRVYGPDLMLAQCRRAVESNQRVWLYGGFDDEALADLQASLDRRFPGLNVVGSWSPPHRALTSGETDDLIDRIQVDAPDVLWVGLGSPKQEVWMREFRGRLEVPVLVGVGAAFDFIAGRVGQAPPWMQKRGLEWLYRLSREPRRLGPRYLKTNPLFVLLAVQQLVRERLIGR